MLFVAGYGLQADGTTYAYDADVWEWDATTNVFTERPTAGGRTEPGRPQQPRRLVRLRPPRGGDVRRQRRGDRLHRSARRLVGVGRHHRHLDGDHPARREAVAALQPPPDLRLAQGDDAGVRRRTFRPTRPTARRRSGSTSPTARRGRTGRAARRRAPSGCASGNCVDGVCCAVPAAQCAGTCMACNVAGATTLGTCSPVPVGLTDDTCPSDQACDANQQCKKPLGQQCGAFSECASGHCADGVCCNTDCNDTCKICSLATSRGTCSFMPVGQRGSGRRAGLHLVGYPGAVVRRRGHLQQPREGQRQAVHGGRPVHERLLHRRRLLQQPVRPDLLPVRSGGARRDLLPGPERRASITARPRPATARASPATVPAPARRARSRTARPAPAPATAPATTAWTASAASAPAPAPASRAGCPARSARASTCRPARRTRTRRRPATGASYCDAAGTCQTGSKPNGLKCTAASECGSGFCVDAVCCVNACTGACSTCNGDTPGTCGAERTGFADPACPANQYCNDKHTCTMGKKPNGAVCAQRHRMRFQLLHRRHVLREHLHRRLPHLRQFDRNVHSSRPTGRIRGEVQGPEGVAVCGGTCNGAGACRWAAAGTPCSKAGCQSDGFIKGAGTCDGAGNCPAAVTMDCSGFALHHGHDDQHGEVPDGLHEGSGVHAQELLPGMPAVPRTPARNRRARALRPRTRLPAQHAVRFGHAAATASAATTTATSAAVATCPARKGPASRSRRAPIPRRSARATPATRWASARASATARRRASIRCAGNELRPVHGVRRLRPLQPVAPVQGRSRVRHDRVQRAQHRGLPGVQRSDQQPLRFGRRLQGEEHRQGLHGLHRHLHARRRRWRRGRQQRRGGSSGGGSPARRQHGRGGGTAGTTGTDGGAGKGGGGGGGWLRDRRQPRRPTPWWGCWCWRAPSSRDAGGASSSVQRRAAPATTRRSTGGTVAPPALAICPRGWRSASTASSARSARAGWARSTRPSSP